MQRTLCRLAAVGVLMGVVDIHSALAQGNARFEITITNLTRDQTFTPVFATSHQPGLQMFDLGRPAHPALATVAEEGDVAPIMALAQSSPLVLDVTFTGPPPGGFILPGQSRTLSLRTRGGFDYVSLAAMLIPTNDGFFALNGVAGPTGQGSVAHFSPAYDSGSERNDETCASIPGPNFVECGGPGGGGQPSGGEEGYVHIHAGIHGIGDFDASRRDWRNPVARIVIRRVP